MKKVFLRFTCLFLAWFLASCSTEAELADSDYTVGAPVEKVMFSLPAVSFEDADASTRASLERNSSGQYSLKWTEGDVLGVYPNRGAQVDFPIASEYVGTSNAEFDGGGWALKQGYRYAVYYPYNYAYTDKTAIPMSYVGQKQVGNDSMEHLNHFNYFASDNAITATSAVLDFKVNFLGHVVRFDFKMPEAGTFTKLLLKSDKPLAKTAFLDISGDTPVVNADEEADMLTLDLEGVTTNAPDEEIILYMWISPVSAAAMTVDVISDEGKVYRTTIGSRDYVSTRGTNVPRPNSSGSIGAPEFVGYASEVIDFADAKVKAICVENWDTDGDGELSYDEAAAVTDLNTATTRSGDGGSVFTGNTEITSFDELSNFTGVTAIPANAFLGCENLASVTIPENVTTIGEAAFKGCWNLEEITLLPTSVPTLEGDAASVFVSTNDCPIKVPEESLDAYVSEWGLYADRIDPDLKLLTNLNLIAAAEASAGQEFKNKNADGTVVLDEVNRAIAEAVTILNLDGNNDPTICDEIAYFVNLEELRCRGNQLTSLDVSQNTKLTKLVCLVNQLTTLDVSKNTLLQYLNCEENQLKTIDLSHNTSLTDLYCPHNLLTSLDLSNNRELKTLFCNNNQLTSLDLSKNNALSWLICPFNQLVSLDISENTALTLSKVQVNGQTDSTMMPQTLTLYVNETQSHQTLSDNDNVLVVLKGSDSEIINFADDNVKSICVNNWDTNGDGELSMAEAAAVADIGDVFRAKDDGGAGVIRKIKSFDEFQYFTSVTEINNAFIGAESMTSIVLPRSLRKIGPSAFRICSSLESIELPDGLVEIGNMAFASCSSIQTIEIPESVMTIGTYAFSGCSLINSFNIPRNVTSIGHSVVSSCNALSTITVDPNNSVYDSRNNCNAIIEKATNTLIAGCKDTNIPSTVTRIGDYAFSNCSEYNKTLNLTNITAVGSQAFYGTNITGVQNIPVTLTVIGDRAFPTTIDGITVATGNPVYDSRENCNAIIETATNKMLVVSKANKGFIPSSVEILPNSLFASMTGLDHVTIPASVKTIGSSLFQDSDVKNVTLPEGITTIPSGLFYRCASLISVDIPSTVTEIGSYAFYGTSSIEGFVLPESVQSIGDMCFMNSSATSITIHAATPPTLNIFSMDFAPRIFTTLTGYCQIYVPASSVDAYKAAAGWSKLANWIQAIP